jgi:hypothetical protein
MPRLKGASKTAFYFQVAQALQGGRASNRRRLGSGNKRRADPIESWQQPSFKVARRYFAHDHEGSGSQGKLARDQALLNGAELDLVRYKTLLATNATSKQQCDAQDALFLASSGPFAPLGKRGTGPCAGSTVALSMA